MSVIKNALLEQKEKDPWEEVFNLSLTQDYIESQESEAK